MTRRRLARSVQHTAHLALVAGSDTPPVRQSFAQMALDDVRSARLPDPPVRAHNTLRPNAPTPASVRRLTNPTLRLAAKDAKVHELQSLFVRVHRLQAELATIAQADRDTDFWRLNEAGRVLIEEGASIYSPTPARRAHAGGRR